MLSSTCLPVSLTIQVSVHCYYIMYFFVLENLFSRYFINKVFSSQFTILGPVGGSAFISNRWKDRITLILSLDSNGAVLHFLQTFSCITLSDTLVLKLSYCCSFCNICLCRLGFKGLVMSLFLNVICQKDHCLTILSNMNRDTNNTMVTSISIIFYYFIFKHPSKSFGEVGSGRYSLHDSKHPCDTKTVSIVINNLV